MFLFSYLRLDFSLYAKACRSATLYLCQGHWDFSRIVITEGTPKVMRIKTKTWTVGMIHLVQEITFCSV